MARLEPIAQKDGSVIWMEPEGTHVRAVDLEVYSRARLAPLVTAFGQRVCVLYEGRVRGRYFAAFELHGWQLTENQEIRRFVAMVRRLPPAARRVWDGAQSRTFDIGVQARETPRSSAFTLSSATIAAVASIGGRIAVTTYAPEPPEERLTVDHVRAALT
jgi:hypothetical protein